MRYLILAALIFLTACAAPRPPLSTASGNPEILIEGVTRKEVADMVVDRLTARGMTIRSVSEYKIVAGKPATDLATQVFFGSRYDGTPEYRLHFTLIDQGAGIKVYSRAEVVTNPGSGFERVTDMTDNANHDLQTMLTKLRGELMGAQSMNLAPAIAAGAATSPVVALPDSTNGKSAYQAEMIAKTQACATQPRATLSASGAGFETYSVPCSNGDALAIRCEFGNCRVLR